MRKMLLIDLFCYVVSITILVLTWQIGARSITTNAFYAIGSLVLTILSAPVMGKVFLYLFLAPWHEITKKDKHVDYKLCKQPLVSVILPAYNEEVGIIATIKTLLASSYRNIEIVVVNDGSTDNSNMVIHQFLAKYTKEVGKGGIPILYQYKQNGGKAAALNAGIALSHGEIIVSIDADCLLSKDCILHFVLALQDPDIQAVCGNVKVANRNNWLGQIQMVEYSLSFYSRQADAILGTLYVISGAAGAYRRSVFDTIGMYNTTLRGGGEDVDLSIRAQQAGMRIGFASEANVYTEAPDTLYGLYKQRKRWTRSRFDTFRRYSKMILSRKREHNKFLSWLVFPLIIFNDWFYLLKVVLKTALYVYCIFAQQYTLLAMLLIVTTILTLLPLLANKEYRPYFWITPIYWLLGFVPFYIEACSIWRTLWDIAHKQENQWQRWNRQGAIAQVKKKGRN